MRARLLHTSLLAAGVLLAGCAAPEPSAQDQNLIGGEHAGADDAPATVFLPNGCSAAQVGSGVLLTAAHCVYSASKARLSSAYGSGATLELRYAAGEAAASAVVRETLVNEAWMLACAVTFCGPSEITGKLDAADVALIVLEQQPEGVAIAAVDTTSLVAGDAIVLAGYGCEQGFRQEDARKEPTLALADSSVAAASEVVHEGSFMTDDDVALMQSSYFVSLGPGADEDAAGLCPGDSGGPVYRRAAEGLVVVGVNANYTVGPENDDPLGLPVTNWHTRLDADSQHGIAGWLAENGVTAASKAE
jgi:secreted trypsin-like serine protease